MGPARQLRQGVEPRLTEEKKHKTDNKEGVKN